MTAGLSVGFYSFTLPTHEGNSSIKCTSLECGRKLQTKLQQCAKTELNKVDCIAFKSHLSNQSPFNLLVSNKDPVNRTPDSVEYHVIIHFRTSKRDVTKHHACDVINWNHSCVNLKGWSSDIQLHFVKLDTQSHKDVPLKKMGETQSCLCLIILVNINM